MRLYPNAKINIGLHVIEKRPDGYHNLETVFYPIPLTDELNILLLTESKNEYFENDYIFQHKKFFHEDAEQNLVIKAFRLLQQDFKIKNIDVELIKHIPLGAGLGGGSSDAAYMLKALNLLYDLNLSDEMLEKYAVQLGADCPFFIQNRPVFASGIGNQLTPINLSLNGLYLVLVKPDIHISTQEAYAVVTPQKPPNSLIESINEPIENWKYLICNNFESSVSKRYPIIPQIKQMLYNQGAIYASMSGSGSSVYGIFHEHPSKLQGVDNFFVFSCEL